MQNNVPLIGIFGGTFDPVHCGHIEIAQRLLLDLKLTQIQFIPNKVPPHRQSPYANSADRLAMLQLATRGLDRILVNDIELQREGPSYTIDTLKLLQQENPHAALCLILGDDVFENFNQWHQWQDILTRAHIIVVNRTTAAYSMQSWVITLLAKHQTLRPENLTQTPAGKIFLYHTDPITISATTIRDQLAAGTDVSKQLPPSVLHYIYQHRLYNSKPIM
jgi:nicotinate-nucleotide adenylyltransferase